MPKKKDTKPPATGAEEKATLQGFLDYLRTAIAAKAEGVPNRRSARPGCLQARACSAWSGT